jgi:hypothetical protein
MNILRVKKKYELVNIQNVLKDTTFCAIINVQSEDNEEFFNLRHDICEKGFVFLKLKKNYYGTLLGMQKIKMYCHLSGTNYVIAKKSVNLGAFTHYYEVITRYNTRIQHVVTLHDGIYYDLERLHRNYFNFRNLSFSKILPSTLQKFKAEVTPSVVKKLAINLVLVISQARRV